MSFLSKPTERIHSRVRRILPLLLVLGLSPASQSVSGSVLTLSDAQAIAIANAPMIEARDAVVSAASEDLVRADALPDPVLFVGVQNLPVGGPNAYTLDEDPMTMRRIGVVQVMPSRAKREARQESAEATRSQAEAGKIASVLEVKRATAAAWVDAWAAEKERALLVELREQASLAITMARARLEGGEGSATEVLAARSAELDLVNRIDDADARIEQARAGLARWLPQVQLDELGDAPDFADLPRSESELLEQLDRQGPLLVWDAREDAADAALNAAKAEKRPDWSIGTGFARRGGDASNVIWLEVGVGLPMFPANRQDRGVNARRSDLQAVRAAREDARRIQVEQVRRQVADWSLLGRKVQRFENGILPLEKDRSEAALAAYSGGAPLSGWLEARKDEISSRVDYARLLADWGQAWAALAWLLPVEAAR